MARQRRAAQLGLTIVELLVATAVGLLVLLAAQVLFASANAAYVAQGQAAEAQQGGRYALDTIGRALRQSGWRDLEQADLGKPFDTGAPAHVAGLDAHSISKGGDGIADPLPSSVNGSDVLAVRFSGAGPAPVGDGTMLSCAGFPAHEHAEGWSIFYVARGADGTGELRCKYRANGGWGADAVVTGVDSFQVLYGLDTDDPGDGVANRYVNASAIEALDAGLVLAGTTSVERAQDLNRRTHWKRVASVQYALLLRGEEARGLGRNRIYDLFGPAYGDRFGQSDAGTRLSEGTLAGAGIPRQRRIFSATVALRGGQR